MTDYVVIDIFNVSVIHNDSVSNQQQQQQQEIFYFLPQQQQQEVFYFLPHLHRYLFTLPIETKVSFDTKN